MGKRLQTIYELLNEYTEKEINEALASLDKDEQNIIVGRYGLDLHNPVTSSSFTKEDRLKFYGSIIPKLKKILTRGKMSLSDLLENEQSPATSFISIPKVNIDSRKQLIELIKNGKSNNEICEALNISRDELYNLLLELKNRGTLLGRKYYSDGTIRYKCVHKYDELICVPTEQSIITDPTDLKMKFLVISDLHFGNSKQRVDLINKAYEYCAKNNINHILCCGDLIDGSYSREEKIISDLYEQIEFFVNNYPSDKNILTLGVTGDHDFSAITHSSLSIIEMCNNYRHDIILGGNNLVLNLKNDKIHLFHLKNSKIIESVGAPLLLQGHFHKYSTSVENGALYITVPSLSDLTNSIPTALEIEVSFEKGYIQNLNVKQILFGEKAMVLNETLLDLLLGRDIKSGYISNTERYKSTEKVSPKMQKVKKIQEKYNFD